MLMKLSHRSITSLTQRRQRHRYVHDMIRISSEAIHHVNELHVKRVTRLASTH